MKATQIIATGIFGFCLPQIIIQTSKGNLTAAACFVCGGLVAIWVKVIVK